MQTWNSAVRCVVLATYLEWMCCVTSMNNVVQLVDLFITSLSPPVIILRKRQPASQPQKDD